MSLTELGASVKDGSAGLAVAALVIAVASLRAAYRVTGVRQAQARDYLGAQTCSANLAEVRRLHQLGIGREEFKALIPERVWQLGQSLQPRASRDRL